MRTKNGLPRHCSWNFDRANGKRRVRFRKGGLQRDTSMARRGRKTSCGNTLLRLMA